MVEHLRDGGACAGVSDEREDWQALVTSPGWQRLLVFVKSQWGAAAYKQKIEQAILEAEEKHQDAIVAVKLVNRVSSELTLIMNHPNDRLETLDKLQLAQAQTPGRRGRL